MMPRTIRLLAVASPVPATERGAEQAESVYAVASDETFWVGEWRLGQFAWKQLASIPQTTEARDAE